MTAPGALRLSSGSAIDRARPMTFSFDGKSYSGFAGDTLASALLANGIRVVGRSFKYHRPRGVLTAGIEEPNALVTLVRASGSEPNVRATTQLLYEGLVAQSQNAWPSLRFDVGRIADALHAFLPAGFYNKTFMWPSWHVFEPWIRRAAGLGVAPVEPDVASYDWRNAHCDVLVIGGGRSGREAARQAATLDQRVILIEQEGWVPALESLDGAGHLTTLSSTRCIGIYDHSVVTAVQHVSADAEQREHYWRIRARRIVVATGAIEQPLVFSGNDRPGIVLSAAMRKYLDRYGVVLGRRVAVLTASDEAYDTAYALVDGGVEVTAIVDVRATSRAAESAALRGLVVHVGCQIIGTSGTRGVRRVAIRLADGSRRHIDCDAVAMCGGFAPALHFLAHAGGRLAFDEGRGALVPNLVPAAMEIVGRASGRPLRADATPDAAPGSHHQSDPSRAWVDFQHDVTVSDIELAVRENFVSVEHLKRYTTTGMAPDQGKTSNVNALAILARSTNRTIDATGTTTFRPPYAPVAFGAIAGGRSNGLFRPIRRLPTHARQIALGAVFEDFAGWQRPVRYPLRGEAEVETVSREMRAVRERVGLFEASPLGKILIRGSDAAALVERVYANSMRTLQAGRVRYGLMLNEKGIVIDDGVCARLDADTYWVGTTSGGADRITRWFEEWLQCEWTTLDAVVTPVTTQWATIALTGPNARAVLSQLAGSIDLSPEAFPHMHVRDGTLLGMSARIARVSFTGELTYEINVPASRATELWDALMNAGAQHGITPFGVDAIDALRVEKGYLHVGSDTDGTTIPADVGFGDAVTKKLSDFVGRRSLRLAENERTDRFQFVGVQLDDGAAPLVVGSHVLNERPTRVGGRTHGYVTSACWSPTLSRYVGLGLIERGRERIGESVLVFDAGRTFPGTIVEPQHLDPAGGRLHA